jgi:hypothetical protein
MVSWTTFLGVRRELHYFVEFGDDGPERVLILDPLGATEAEPLRAYAIELTTTEPGFGGRRYWFRCPLAPEGDPCGRRSRVLYVPQFAHYLGCTACHGLTYASRQKHRQALYMGIQRPLDALLDYRSRAAASEDYARTRAAHRRSREALARQTVPAVPGGSSSSQDQEEISGTLPGEPMAW